MTLGRADITVLILTYNEEKHISRALASVHEFATRVVLIDSFSTDRTLDLARAAGATIVQNKFVNQAQQFQWALDNVSVTTQWVMRLDADEVVESELAVEIRQRLPELASDVVGVNLKRKHIFMERWIRFGARFPLLLLRIWRVGRARVERRWMDEHILVSGGRTVTFAGCFQDHNLNDITYFIDKHNKYATREAIEVIGQREGLFPRDSGVTQRSTSLQTSFKHTAKAKVFNLIPFPLGPLLYFGWRYVIRLGFLDGKAGLIYHFLQGFWYRFLVGAKVIEFSRAIAGLSNREAKLRQLSLMSGLDLDGQLSG
jgi:glycosyltransferase involved in cell wall biosynthesis